MVNVLVCIKRVPDVGSEVLAERGRAVGRRAPRRVHDQRPRAVRGRAGRAGQRGRRRHRDACSTVGAAEAVEQLRSALGVGCTAAILVEADPVSLGPADVARAIAEVVRDHAARPGDDAVTYDLVLLGNDAADSGDYQVPIRLATRSNARWSPACRPIEVRRRGRALHRRGPLGTETYAVPLPAVVSVMEGGVEPRYPTITGRMKAKKIEIETRALSAPARGQRAGAAHACRRPTSTSSEVLGEGTEAAGAVVDLFQRLGVAR